MKTDDQLLAEAERRLQERRKEQGKDPLPSSMLKHGGGFVFIGDVLRGLRIAPKREEKAG